MKKIIMFIIVTIVLLLIVYKQNNTMASIDKETFQELKEIYPDIVGEWIVEELVIFPRVRIGSYEKKDIIGSNLNISKKAEIFYNNKKIVIDKFEKLDIDFMLGCNYYRSDMYKYLFENENSFIIKLYNEEDFSIIIASTGVYIETGLDYSDVAIYKLEKVK